MQCSETRLHPEELRELKMHRATTMQNRSPVMPGCRKCVVYPQWVGVSLAQQISREQEMVAEFKPMFSSDLLFSLRVFFFFLVHEYKCNTCLS